VNNAEAFAWLDEYQVLPRRKNQPRMEADYVAHQRRPGQYRPDVGRLRRVAKEWARLNPPPEDAQNVAKWARHGRCAHIRDDGSQCRGTSNYDGFCRTHRER